MQLREKIMVTALLYLAGGYMWVSLASPAFMQNQDKNTELDGKKKEQAELKVKLANLATLQREQVELSKQIDELRGSVPKSPDSDILVIDLERMALASQLDILAFGPPEKEKEQMASDTEQLMAQDSDIASIVASQKDAQAKTAKITNAFKQGGSKQGLKPEEKKTAEQVDLGLNKMIKQVNLVGNYPGLVEFMKRMESYQRVISINQVEFELPLESGPKKRDEVRQPVTSFLMTAYYLP